MKSIQITPYIEINALLSSLLDHIQQILPDRLIGLYLYGSLVTDDFDKASSDIDLLAVTRSPIDDLEFTQLQQMHNDFVAVHPGWNDRIEIAYLSIAALQTFRSQRSQIAIISPGEPFHTKEAGNDWLINWWVVRERGVALCGPAPAAIIEPISTEEFLRAVRVQAQDWREWVYHMQSRPAQAYAIVTLCRALYAHHHGEQASKPQAALWVQGHFPQWAWLIQKALVWRQDWRDAQVDHAATLPVTVQFVHFAIDQIAPPDGIYSIIEPDHKHSTDRNDTMSATLIQQGLLFFERADDRV